MALTDKTAQRDGWQHQAEHADLDPPVGRMAPVAAEQARQRPLLKLVTPNSRSLSADFEPGKTSKIELARESERLRTKFAEFEQQVAQEPATAARPNEHLETLAVKAAAADKRFAELEAELDLAREQLVLQENENYSLQTSLGLIVSEKSRLSHRLTESNSAVHRAYSELEQKKTALTLAEAERNKLTAAVDEANETHLAESTAPTTRLQTMSARAAAEAEAWLRLLARTETIRAAERKVTHETLDRCAVDKKLELLQNSLQLRERQVRELDQSRSKLIDDTDALLNILKTRDAALARAKESIKFLAERVTQLEAEAKRIKSKETTEELNSQIQSKRVEHTIAEGAGKKTHANWTELLHELGNYVRHNDKCSERIKVRVTEALLADTITF